MKAILLKLDSAVHKIWTTLAKKESMTLSEWIRARVSEAVLGDLDGKDTPADTKRLRRAAAPRRRTGVATRKRKPLYDTEKFVHQTAVTFVDKQGTITEPKPGIFAPAAHDASCQCGVCDFRRKNLGKQK